VCVDDISIHIAPWLAIVYRNRPKAGRLRWGTTRAACQNETGCKVQSYASSSEQIPEYFHVFLSPISRHSGYAFLHTQRQKQVLHH
jgi:hypothetical protein